MYLSKTLLVINQLKHLLFVPLSIFRQENEEEEDEEEKKKKWMRPPSSYGSMKSESDEMEEEEEEGNEEVAKACHSPFPVVLPALTPHMDTGYCVFVLIIKDNPSVSVCFGLTFLQAFLLL